METREVVKYAMEHFDAEEALMRSRKYPAYEEHLAKHNVFRDWTDTLATELEGETDLDEYTIRLSKWLIEWFCDQVLTDDRKLAAFLKKTA
jgi:hemerythrin